MHFDGLLLQSEEMYAQTVTHNLLSEDETFCKVIHTALGRPSCEQTTIK
jgi:hypothetical protein